MGFGGFGWNLRLPCGGIGDVSVVGWSWECNHSHTHRSGLGGICMLEILPLWNVSWLSVMVMVVGFMDCDEFPKSRL
jgi:hypothetical protein